MSNINRFFVDHLDGTITRHTKVYYACPKGANGNFLCVSIGKEAVKVSRTVKYSTVPSLHKCDARCSNAKGFNCQCSCGGANHGTGK